MTSAIRPETAPLDLPKPRQVRLDQLGIDSDYQRDRDMNRVRQMIRDWDIRQCGPLLVSARGGRLWIVDGQHRHAAMSELGLTHAWAIILEGLTKQEEADLFIKSQTGRKALNAWDLFRAGETAAYADVLTILRITHKHGFRLAQTKGPNHIAAIGAVKRIYVLGGETLLSATFGLIIQNWPIALSDADSLAKQGISLEGVAVFLNSFQSLEVYNPQRTAGILQRHAAASFAQKAQEIAMRRMRANVGATTFAEAMREIYNAGIGPAKKLVGPVRRTKASPGRPRKSPERHD